MLRMRTSRRQSTSPTTVRRGATLEIRFLVGFKYVGASAGLERDDEGPSMHVVIGWGTRCRGDVVLVGWRNKGLKRS